MSTNNLDVSNESEARLPEPQWAKETALIQHTVALFVEVMDSIKIDDDVKSNDLLKEIYLRQLTGMQANMPLLINSHQTNEETLSNLLDLSDWIDAVIAQYLRRMGSPVTLEAPKSKETQDEPPVLVNEDNGCSSGDESLDDCDSDEEDDITLERNRSIPSGSRKDKGKSKMQDITLTTVAVSSVEVTDATTNTKPPLVKAGYKIAEGPGECPICCEEDVPPSDLFIFDTCEHQYCRECLQGYFANRIAEGKVLEITCPCPGCKTLVEYTQVQSVVTQDLFNKYVEFTFIASLNADPSVRWCPKVGCGNAIIGDPENPRCRCTNTDCAYEFCFLCSEPWHEDATCEQYQEWKVASGLTDTKFNKWAKKNAKKCPQCKTMIEKISGCNHMTCSNCKFEFCWLCGGRYSSSHFDVFNVLGCPGMQSGNKQFGVVRRIGMRALIGTGLVVGGILGTALAIPAAVVAGPIYGGYKLHQRRKRNCRRARRYR